MDLKFQTSFIPKRPVVATGMTPSRGREPLNFFSFIAMFIFIIALVASGAVFLYQRTLASSNDGKRAQIKAEIAAFDPALIEKLSMLKARIDGAGELLRSHLALTAFFGLLQNNTVATIRFKDFAFSSDKTDSLRVSMHGVARSFNDIVFQSDTILANSYIKNALFSNFELDPSGNVEFLLTADIDPSLVSYTQVLDRLSASAQNIPVTPITPVTQATSTSATSTPATSTPPQP